MLKTRSVSDWAVVEHKVGEEEKSAIDLYAKWSERRHGHYKLRFKIVLSCIYSIPILNHATAPTFTAF